MIDDAFFYLWNYHAFQGSPYGQKMNFYRKKGDGLQTYDIFQNGYTYKIFIWNDPFPKTYLAKKDVATSF